jgi:macrolide transport system ATP-binding/permease protein
MNIMLVSVSERTREIGVRTAVGARRSDIMSQFMIEAVLVCLIGGALGVALSMAIGGIFSLFVKSFQLVYSGWTLLAAFGVSTLIGLIFGWLPARNAAALDPVDALARE